MRNRALKPLSVLCCVALLVASGCEFIRQHRGAVIGSGAGALAGGIIGHQIGGRRGTVIGGLLGALAGGAIGHYAFDQKRTAAQTRADYSYAPQQGVRVEMAGARANPAAVAPGGQCNLEATYALMAPNDQQPIQLTETRVVTLGGQKVAEASSPVTRTPGTYTSRVPMTLPANAPTGDYDVDITVAAAGTAPKQTRTAFSVR